MLLSLRLYNKYTPIYPQCSLLGVFWQYLASLSSTPYRVPMLPLQIGVELGPKGQIKVDGFNQTTVPSIFAVGDVTDRVNLTPVALMEGMAFAKNIFG